MLLVAIGLFVAPNPVTGQQPSGDELRRVEPARPLHGSKGSHEVDVAASRADAHAQANGQQSTDVDEQEHQHQHAEDRRRRQPQRE